MTAFRILARAGLIVFLSLAAVQAQDSVFQDDDSLETIRQKIERNGYGFTVGHNWVFDMTPEQKKAFFSRHPSASPHVSRVSDAIGPLAERLGKTALPASFDWRSYNGHSYIGAVRNQGSCGSCYSFGASAAAEVVYNYANGLFDADAVDFSESFIIWCLARLDPYGDHFYGCDGADYEYMELEALVQEGTINESDFPYRTSDPGSCAHYGDPRITFAAWHRIPCNDITAIKTAIMTYGAVDVAVYAGSAFDAYSGGIYQDGNTACSGSPTCAYAPTNHAVALVGWNDAEGVWILRNSWGPSWGENGYMRIKYTSARVGCSAAYLVYDAAPGLTVTAPAAGAGWTAGTTQTIAWNKVGSQDATVYIELFKGGAKALDITASTANDGSFDWAIPAGLSAGSDYVVRVITSDGAYADDSGAFSIVVVTPAIVVTAPAAGTAWNAGTTQTIAWTRAGALDADVRIELFKGGAKVLDITASTANDGSHSWAIPAGLSAGSDYVVRVTTADGAVFDDSGLFTITVTPAIVVTTPAAGATWMRGARYTILWTKIGTQGAKVKISLLRNGVLKKEIVLSTSNDGSFEWKVGTGIIRGSGYQIRVKTLKGNIKGLSGAFAID